MGAFGAALIAVNGEIQNTTFKGFDIAESKIVTQNFICDGCPNQCEVVDVLDVEKIITRSGGRCGRCDYCKTCTI